MRKQYEKLLTNDMHPIFVSITRDDFASKKVPYIITNRDMIMQSVSEQGILKWYKLKLFPKM